MRNMKLKPVQSAVMAACLCISGLAQADNGAVTTQDVSVLGQGATRETETLTQADLQIEAAGTNPLKALEILPGVQFDSSDPWGNYEWSEQITIRGFNQNQLGFTLDGIPLGDMSYGNNNGLSIGRAIAPENISTVSVAQGTGALGTASTSNLGGTVEFTSSDPRAKAGVETMLTGGDSSTGRVFLRVDTGTFSQGNTTAKAYFSYSNDSTDKWKGWGSQKQQLWNGKLVFNVGNNSKISLFGDISHRDETDYADLSLQSAAQLGFGFDNYAPNWNRAVNAANGIYTGGVQNLPDPLDAAYYLGRGLRDDELTGLTGDFRLSDSVQFKAVLYTHHNRGEGQWYTPYTPSSASVPISVRTTEYGIRREGINASVTWQANDVNTVAGGLWLEHNVHDLARRFYAINGPVDTDYYLVNPFYTQFQQQFVVDTRQLWAQDTLSLLNDRLTLVVGAKSPDVTISSTNYVGSLAAGSISSSGFLPQASMNYQIDKHNEVFATVAENQRAFQPGVSGPFSATQTTFNAIAPGLKPETSVEEDLGVRTHQKNLEASFDLYNVDFKNRLLTISQCAGIVGCANALANVGSVNTKGMEAAVRWLPVDHFSVMNSLTYNNSQYQSDYNNGGTLVATAGKTVVDAPKWMYALRFGYEKDGFFGDLTGKYTGSRYITYLNDAQVPAYWVWDLSAGYKQDHLGPVQDFRIQLNVVNLLNKDYFSSLGTNGYVASDPTGAYYTLQAGAPRMAFLTLSGRY